MQYWGCRCVWVGWGCATIGATFQQAEIYVGYKLRGLRRLLDRLYQAKSGANTQITNMSAADKLQSRAHPSGTESRRVVVAVVVVAVIVVIAVYSLVLIGWKPGGKIKSLWCHTKQQMGCNPPTPRPSPHLYTLLQSGWEQQLPEATTASSPHFPLPDPPPLELSLSVCASHALLSRPSLERRCSGSRVKRSRPLRRASVRSDKRGKRVGWLGVGGSSRAGRCLRRVLTLRLRLFLGSLSLHVKTFLDNLQSGDSSHSNVSFSTCVFM